MPVVSRDTYHVPSLSVNSGVALAVCPLLLLLLPSQNVPYAPPRQGEQNRAHVKVHCAARPNPGRHRVQLEPEARRAAQMPSQQPSDHRSDCHATVSFRLQSANKSGYNSVGLAKTLDAHRSLLRLVKAADDLLHGGRASRKS